LHEDITYFVVAQSPLVQVSRLWLALSDYSFNDGPYVYSRRQNWTGNSTVCLENTRMCTMRLLALLHFLISLDPLNLFIH